MSSSRNTAPLSPIEEEWTDAGSPISDAATLIGDEWETSTLVGDDWTAVAPESPALPPMPITESNQPNRRTLMIPYDDDLQFRDLEVPLVPVSGSSVDLSQRYRVQHPAPPPTPVIRPVADGNTARIPLFRLDGGSAPFTVGGIVHIWRGVAYVEGPRRQILAQAKPVIVKEDPARRSVRQPQPQRRRVPPGAQENLDDRTRGEYHTSMIPPILGHNESMDEFVVRLRRHMQYIRDFTRSAGLDTSR